LVSNAFAHSLCSLAPLPRSLLGSTCAPGYASSLAPLADGIFTISQVLSPLLPIALVAGQFAASGRLTRKGLFTLNPKRIAIAGKIRIYAFDKTGTITKDGLDFIGAEMPDPATGHLVSPDVSRGMAPPTLSRGLASCHAVSFFGDTLVGNEVEVKMFTASGWSLDESGDKPRILPPSAAARSSIASRDWQGGGGGGGGGGVNDIGALVVEKRFEFDHKRMTMSVVVRDERTGVFHVFCKGSAECVGARCLAGSLPRGYDEQARGFALQGCYVLSLAHRELTAAESADVAQLGVDHCEKGLAFVALINFRNELKPDSAEAMVAIKKGNVRPIMITGDNAQCGFYIAKESGMISRNARVLLAECSGGGVQWQCVEERAKRGRREGDERAKRGRREGEERAMRELREGDERAKREQREGDERAKRGRSKNIMSLPWNLGVYKLNFSPSPLPRPPSPASSFLQVHASRNGKRRRRGGGG
jgi:cation-transporting ATPase 13A3/4/5